MKNIIVLIVSVFFVFTADRCLAQGTWITSQEGTVIWNPNPVPNVSCCWTGGKDSSGKAQGSGVLVWIQQGNIIEVTVGSLKEGKIVTVDRQIKGKAPRTRPLSAYEQKQQELCRCCLEKYDSKCCAQIYGDCSQYGFSEEQSSEIKEQVRKQREIQKKTRELLTD